MNDADRSVVPLLEGRELSLTLGRTQVLRGLSISVEGGESVAVMGPSGAGKSSLLHCLAGVLRPSAGEVILAGRRVDDRGEPQMSALRRRYFGFVFQFGDLLPELSLVENAAIPARLLGARRRVAERSARTVLEQLGIGALAERRPSDVSGGELQRAAIARAVGHSPRVIFADEPTGALDSATAAATLDLLFDQQLRNGAALLIVTHDPQVAARADRTVHVRDGALDGSVAVIASARVDG